MYIMYEAFEDISTSRTLSIDILICKHVFTSVGLQLPCYNKKNKLTTVLYCATGLKKHFNFKGIGVRIQSQELVSSAICGRLLA